jgi:hypothetical protein
MKKKFRILKSQYSYGGYFVQIKNGFFSFWKYAKDSNGFIIMFTTAAGAENYIEEYLDLKNKEHE